MLRVLATLALCVMVATADKPHVMHKLVAKCEDVDKVSNTAAYQQAFYVDSAKKRARADKKMVGEEKGGGEVRTGGKLYSFTMDSGLCVITERGQSGDPAYATMFGTFLFPLAMRPGHTCADAMMQIRWPTLTSSSWSAAWTTRATKRATNTSGTPAFM